MIASEYSTETTPLPLSSQPRVLYVRRWFIVISVALLNTSNALVWNSFATVAASTKTYYNVDFGAVNMLSVVYMVISIPVGFFAIWSLDSLGLRMSLYGSATLNAIGPVIRLLSVFDFVPIEAKYPLLLTGQAIAAISQTPIMFCPPKVAQYWFPENQRAIANTIASMANPLGILLSAVLSPVILATPTQEDMQNLMIAYTVPAIVAFFFTVFSLNRSKPLTPPSDSAEQESEPFMQGVKIILRNKMFLLLMVCFGSGMAIFTALAALVLQILCPYGYNEDYAGVIIGVMVGSGLVGAGVTGFIADATKRFVEVSKVSLSLAGAFFCFFTVVVVFPQQYVLLAFAVGLFGFFGFGQYAICLELAVETTFPVAEATSAGLMVICGQIQSAIIVLVMQPLGIPVNDVYGTCSANATQGSGTLSYIYGNMLLACVAFVAATLLIMFYECPYKRLAFEEQSKAKKTAETAVNQSASGHIYVGATA